MKTCNFQDFPRNSWICVGFIVLGNNVHNSKFQKLWDSRGNHTEMGKIMLKTRVLPYIFAAREFPGHSFFRSARRKSIVRNTSLFPGFRSRGGEISCARTRRILPIPNWTCSYTRIYSYRERIWVRSPRSGQTGERRMELLPGLFHLIFQGWGARARISVLPLLFAGKKSRGCVFGGGVPFWKNGTRYSAFWSWCAIQIFLENLIILEFLEIHGDFQFLRQKPSYFFHPNRILRTFTCKMLFLGANLEFPGAVFLMSSAGAKRSKNTPFWGVEGIGEWQKVCSVPRSGDLPGGPVLHFPEKMNFCISMPTP